MKKIILKYNLFFVVFCLLVLIIDWIRWDIAIDRIAIVGNILIIFMILLNSVLIICGVTIFIKFFKKHKINSLIIILILMCTLALQTVLPLSTGYLNFNYHIFQTQRKQIMYMYENKGLEKYHLDKNEYKLPLSWRLLSHTGTFYLEKDESILFYIHAGLWKSSAILYLPNNVQLNPNAYKKIIYMDSNWYGVIF